MYDVIAYRDVTVTVPGGAAILDRVSLAIGQGERVAYLGRSGAGKTTALKVINGLVTPSSGALLVDGTPVAQHALPELRRRIGYVMQQPALFPHRSVFDNIATVPRLLQWPEEKTRAEVERQLAQLDLPFGTFAERFPRTLSGGQQQRVAIARALIASPAILLCDEPFSALDPLIRAELQTLLRNATQERAATTLVFVTHDVREALRIAERVILFDGGRVVVDTPSAAFPAHEHPLVRRFVEA
ncbi:MAG TPA: ATP-binding cassette domain-containing protein [Thermoanaerobaculia bacterium]|nr:ATP-binding cassette domain-containing protein [Thermoanaerobaculia bacterium]